MTEGKDPSAALDSSGIQSLTSWLSHLIDKMSFDKIVYPLLVIVGLVLLLWIIYVICRFLIFRPIAKSQFAAKRKGLNQLLESRLLGSLATVVGIVVVDILLEVVPLLESESLEIAHRISNALMICVIAQMIVRMARFADTYYSSLPSINRDHAFGGYVTVGSFAIYAMAGVLIISVLLAKSPIYFLTGLGAISAVLLLVFKDTLLSMFANVLVTTGDLARVGDWITVEGTSADGYVIDVSLNIVKVQNFDKTITSLPTYTLVQNSFVNWRGMYESGGRRIKRSILLDQRSVRMLSENDLAPLRNIPLMDEALKLEKQSVSDNPECSEGLRITNSGLFRQYALAYLQQHPKIHHDAMTLLVRQLQPTENGLPIELYCFTTDTRWAFYEDIQAAIIDHLLSVMPAFGLRVFQAESDFAEPHPSSRKVEIGVDSLVSFEAGQTPPPA